MFLIREFSLGYENKYVIELRLSAPDSYMVTKIWRSLGSLGTYDDKMNGLEEMK